MGAFEYRQAEEIRDAFARHGVRYLFLGKSGAILLGFPDTTQDADVFLKSRRPTAVARRGAARSRLCVNRRRDGEIERGKDFVQLKNGPFDLDLVFAPDGIERFDDAWRRHVDVEGFPVCHIDDIIASKAATDRVKDRESLPRLRAVPRILATKPLSDFWSSPSLGLPARHPHPAAAAWTTSPTSPPRPPTPAAISFWQTTDD